MTRSAVYVLMEWASKATSKQQLMIADRITKYQEENPDKTIDSYDINGFINQVILSKVE